MTHTICQHQVNSYCLNEYSKNLNACLKSRSKINASTKNANLKSGSPKNPLLGQHKVVAKASFPVSKKTTKTFVQSTKKNTKTNNVKTLVKNFKGWPKYVLNNIKKHQSFKQKSQPQIQLSKLNKPNLGLENRLPTTLSVNNVWGVFYFSRHDLAFLSLRSLCSTLLKALHVCLFATLNNKRILFIGDPRPLVKEHQHKYQCCFISSQTKSLSSQMTQRLPPLNEFLQKTSNLDSFFQLLQVKPIQFETQKNFFVTGEEKPLSALGKMIYENKEVLNLTSNLPNKSLKAGPFEDSVGQQPSLKSSYGEAELKQQLQTLEKPELQLSKTYFFNNLQKLVNFSKTPRKLQTTKTSLKNSFWFVETTPSFLENQAFAKAKLPAQFEPSLALPFGKSLSKSKAAILEAAGKVETHTTTSSFLESRQNIKDSKQQNLKSHSKSLQKPLWLWSTKTGMEPNFFNIALTKLICKTALRSSQWTAAFAQAERGWKGGFFSNSRLSYKQNFTFPSKLNIQRSVETEWLTFELKAGQSKALKTEQSESSTLFSSFFGKNQLSLLPNLFHLLDTSSKPQVINYWKAIYYPVAKRKITKRENTYSELQSFQTRNQLSGRRSKLSFTGQIPTTKKLSKNFCNKLLLKQKLVSIHRSNRSNLDRLPSFSLKTALTQITKATNAQFSLNPWLKEADLVFFANPEKSTALLSQVNRLRIPSIGIVNSGENLSFPFRSVKGNSLLSSKPSLTYPIIGNSNSLNFLKMVYSKLIGVLNKKRKMQKIKSTTHFPT